MSDSPFHAGEQALQQRLGVRERLEAVGRMVIRDHMPEQHRELFGRLPTLLLATQDAAGQPWATMLCGAPGFVQTPDAGSLEADTRPADDDPAAAGLRPGAAVGLLGLEPHTRRRNRMNGVVTAVGAGFAVRVLQSFGNCPKYIQAREPQPVPDRVAGAAVAEGASLSPQALALVRGADTLFIASSSAAALPSGGPAPCEGADVSHRGGRPGFVAVRHGPQGDHLIVPDYVGNWMFNTLGNLLQWPQAGLLFLDWHSGDLLQLAATARIEHEGAALAAYPGARRLLHLDVLRGWWRPGAMPLSWKARAPAPEFAPDLLPPA